MLGAPKESATSALILFIPRQVALEARSRSAARKKPEPKAMEKKEKKSKSSTEALVLDCAVEKKETKEKKKKSASQLDRAKGVLLRSIAAYLESNGFSKTLVTLRAEAHLEIDDCKATLLNLEEISCKFLELSGHSESSIDWQKEKDPKVGAMARKDEDEEDHDASGQILKKKRKKNRGNDDGRGVGAGVETGSGGHVDMIPNKQSDRSQVISKEKKAKRSCLESHLAESNEVCENKNQKELKRLEDNTDIKELKHDSKCSDHRSVFDDSHVKTKNKRKKKKLVSDSLVEDNGKDQLDADETVENIDHGSQMPNSHSNKKEMETQRDKMISDACHGSEGSNHGKFEDVVKEKVEELKSLINNSSNVSAKPNAVPKQEKRKKKTKETSDSSAENAEQVKLEASDRVMDANSEDLGSLVCENDHKFQFPDKKGAKGEKRKKRRDRSTPDSIHAANFGELDKGISLDGQEKSAVDHKIQEGLKISDSGIENALTFEDRVDDSGKNTSKKRKRLLSEEAGPQIDSESGAKVSKNVKLEIVEHDKETRTVHKADTFLQVNESQNVGKKRKIEKCHETHNESLDTSLSKTGVLMNCNENSSTQASQKEVEGHQMANGHLNEKERNEGTLSKGMKKEKCSTEPKMVNAFQRVKVDQIKFADERLQDNSYWAKDGADNGYGAKAQEILGQVRGRDFRHEKTKKKRGTYRGGQIDCQSHSIKFNYSDDE